MKKIVVAGRNDAGKSTILGEIYKGLKNKGYQPLAVGSGVQDEKPYLHKGIDVNYLHIAVPGPGRDVVEDIERVIRDVLNKIEEKNKLISSARRALEELNKVRSVLELGSLSPRDMPKPAEKPDVFLVEAVGINDGYKSVESRRLADILVTVIPASIKGEILMEEGNILLDEADIIVVTKIDETPRDVTSTTVKLLKRIYPYKPIIPVVATKGVHTNLVTEEILKMMIDPLILIDKAEQYQSPKKH
ncbi:putative GTPase [Desulfohalotomaculum tongense]|uniref:GTP-binding protein n=1 Tax=Desulforadius tongensis TaxID=1216062 RepID=UPI00195B1CBA|nr:GTP-binding protein [Desulforadius tongensis]MBM7854038.1 putative GTPase [Desulforadius tongensis]